MSLEQAFADQRLQGEQVSAADRFRGRKRTTAHEHRHPLKQHLLFRGKQIVAPANGSPQRALAHRQILTSLRQQGQPGLEPCQHLPGTEDLQPGRRELERQRQAIQPGTDGGKRGSVLGGGLHTGLCILWFRGGAGKLR